MSGNEKVNFNGEFEQFFCDNCDEFMAFKLHQGKHSFMLPLTTVLECLYYAEKRGEVPEIDEFWWLQLSRRYEKIGRLFSPGREPDFINETLDE